jgi:hypothetical protein
MAAAIVANSNIPPKSVVAEWGGLRRFHGTTLPLCFELVKMHRCQRWNIFRLLLQDFGRRIETMTRGNHHTGAAIWRRIVEPRHILITAIAIIGCLPAGCCTKFNTQTPSVVYSGGVKYQLQERLCIDQKLEEQERVLRVRDGLLGSLRKRFPDNKELLTYLDKFSDERKTPSEEWLKTLKDIQADVVQSHGVLYSYRIVKEKAVFEDGGAGRMVEEGWVVIAKGKIYKKYILATGIEAE